MKVSLQPLVSLTISVTVKVPGFENRWLGLTMLSKLSKPDKISPKFQCYFKLLEESIA